MTHDEVLDRQVLDAYVSNRLNAGERAAFERHFFECDVCFDAVHDEDAVRRAVRHLATSGRLAVTATLRRAAGVALPIVLAGAIGVAGGWLLQSRRVPGVEPNVPIAMLRPA